LYPLFFDPSEALKPNTRKTKDLNAIRIRRLVELSNHNSHGIPLDIISLEHKIILCAFIRACADESLETILPIGQDQHSIRLSPSKEYSYELINRLFREKIIRLDSTNTILSDVCINEKEDPVYQTDTAIFVINISGSDGTRLSLKALTEILEESLFVQTKHEENKIEELWKELALQEALEYLAFVLSERDFPFKPGEKTKNVLRQVLTRYSTSQSFYFIFSAAKNASDFYQTKGVPRSHAANTVPGKIQTLFDRSVREGWKVSKYNRNYKACPPSALSNVLYDKVLGLSPLGIDYVPGSVLPAATEEKISE
jgi:hypothetical protein